MTVNINSPIERTIKAQISELQRVVECFRGLKREEEHQIVMPVSTFGHPLLSAGVLSLIEERRREGFLFNMESSAISRGRAAVMDMKNNEVFDNLSFTRDGVLGDRRDLRSALMYMLGELTDNIRDHARVSFGIVSDVIEGNAWSMAVADCGISIPGAYRAAGFMLSDECEALTRAVGGVSTKTVEERGTGLPSVERLMKGAFNGQFAILSGGAFFNSQDLAQCGPAPFFWQGTIVCLEGNIPSQPINFYDYLTR